jgi:hypothetical protein
MIAAGTADVRASVRLVGPNFLSSPMMIGWVAKSLQCRELLGGKVR